MAIDLGRRADYALRATMALCHGDRRLKAREIAAATAAPAFIERLAGTTLEVIATPDDAVGRPQEPSQ